MKVARILLPALLLPWMVSAATLHLKKREAGAGQRNGTIENSGPRWTSGRSHLMLQFRHPLNDQITQELNLRGAYVVGAVPDFGVVVSIPDGFSSEGLDIEWAGRLEMNDKISPLLEHSRGTAPASAPGTDDAWFVAEFFPDVDMQEARRLVEAAGFRVREHPDLVAAHLLLSGSPERLPGLAQWDEVAYVFPASRALMRGRHVAACAGALTTAGTMPMYVTMGSGWPKDGSGQITLSYVFGKITPKLDAAQANQELLRALNAWTQYAPIKFIPGQSGTGSKTVYIQFLTKDHGDGFPFDGPGGILAHTFYPAPPNPESIAGDMHLDGDEDWHIGANTDLFTVALHEAGHALGLAHVDNPASVMYPYYRLGTKIGPDDIAGLQSLYGAPTGSSAPIVTPASPLTLSITVPLPNSSTTGATVALAGTTAGAEGAVKITWQTNHDASGSATGTSQWSASAVPLIPGTNTITVTAADTSHTAVQSVTVTRTSTTSLPGSPVDRTAPSISISSPAGTIFTTTAATIDVRGKASDNVGVAKVTWQTPSASGTATGTTSWTAASIPLLVGNNNIIVRAYDAAGNTSWRSVLVIRN
jgi:hypothetical protein